MSSTTDIDRKLLAAAFPGQLRTQAAFEEQAATVSETTGLVDAVTITADATAATTGLIQDATVITLSSSEAFNNERIFAVGSGLAFVNDGTHVTIDIAPNVLRSTGGFAVTITATAITNITLPASGTLATIDGVETLTSKTLTSPTLTTPSITTPVVTGIAGYANDAAAGAGGVPIGGVYLTGSALQCRQT